MKPLLIVRGHQTKDIQGVQCVVDKSTLQTILPLIHASERELDIAVEYYIPPKDEVIARVNEKSDKIYVGGTYTMWYNLRNHLRHSFGPDYSYENFTIYKPFHYKIKRVALSSMIYERKLRNGTKITALYGSSPEGTRQAVQRYLGMPDLNGSVRIIINNLKVHLGVVFTHTVMHFEK